MTNVRLYGSPPYKAAVVHGGPGALGTVAAIARELAKDFGILEPLQTQGTIAALLEELDEVIATHCGKPISLIGHSWGAWLVFMYAARYPQKVKKIILVGSGPFETHYAKAISPNRMRHLSTEEQKEYNALITALNSKRENDSDRLMGRLGELVDKTDNYCTVEIESDRIDQLPADGTQYGPIWNEAAKLRETGALIQFAETITCPVVAIHGEYDPHPMEGVKLPLENRVRDFTFYQLAKCGHDPWKERYAQERFYEILRKELAE